jgi:hypothetical protein
VVERSATTPDAEPTARRSEAVIGQDLRQLPKRKQRQIDLQDPFR